MIDKFGRPISGSSNIIPGVTKLYIRANYLESNMEEDIDMKNQFKIKNVPNPVALQDVATKNYVDNKNNSFVPIDEFDNETIVRTNKNNNFQGNTILELDSVYVRKNPEFNMQLTSKRHVDSVVDEETLLRKNSNNSVIVPDPQL